MRDITVPLYRLPPGFESALRDPPDPPVEPRPAATLALLRSGGGGLEVLLLKRTPRARFIPGAFVFPGGRVDPEDQGPEVAALLGGPPSETGSMGDSLQPPAHCVAALRETVEETGILLGAGPGGEGTRQLDGNGSSSSLLLGLRSGKTTFPEILEVLGRPALPRSLPLIGHWVTPVQERYRYDTLFFGAHVPAETTAIPDGKELVEGLWITPREALDRNAEGKLPMVFPTLGTLEDLLPFSDPEEALTSLSQREIPRLLPTVEETGDGIRMRV